MEIWRIVGEPDRLDWLIMAGWGNVLQGRIPADVMQAAEEGRMPRQNGKATMGRPAERAAREGLDPARSASLIAKIAALDPRNCQICGQDYQPTTIGEMVTCPKRACRLEHRRRRTRGKYQRQALHYRPRMDNRVEFQQEDSHSDQA